MNTQPIKFINGFINLNLMSDKEYSIFIRNLKQIIKKHYMDNEKKIQ